MPTVREVSSKGPILCKLCDKLIADGEFHLQVTQLLHEGSTIHIFFVHKHCWEELTDGPNN